MMIIVDARRDVLSAYETGFTQLGVSASKFLPEEFSEWVGAASDPDVDAVEAFLLGACDERRLYPGQIRERSRAPVIALNETPSLEQTLELFAAGVDDVLRKPVHIREILARIGVIRRRHEVHHNCAMFGELSVYFDGRDPDINGRTFLLPRRERRILEFLVAHAGKRVTKAQIFNAIYGLFDEDVDECVVESHVSKLRKKLRGNLGYDPIDSKRYLGYTFTQGVPRGF